MRLPNSTLLPDEIERARWQQLEERIARLERHLGIGAEPAPNGETDNGANAFGPVFADRSGTEDEFEFEVGQSGFALAGIGALTAGVIFLLSLPHARLPAAAPSLAGASLAVGLLGVAHAGRRTFTVAASYLRGAAMALMGFAALRLFFLGAVPALAIGGAAGRLAIVAAITANFAVAIRERSPWLLALALAIGSALGLAAGAAAFFLPLLVVVAIAGVAVGRRAGGCGVVLAGQVSGYATYLLWALGNPLREGRVQFVREPWWTTATVLVLVLLWGAAPLLARERRGEHAATNVVALLNATLGYGVLLLHSAAISTRFAAVQLAAAAVYLVLAIAWFVRERSRVATFFYAMTGYAALSMAIAKLSAAPEVFVWLSLQSVVVVATAIGFRSRFIVVGNFFVFAGIVLAYVFTVGRETGISMGFGVVALVSARILNWQQHRLELKTDLMRNAYLASAFVVFPYAVYHLVPVRLVAVAWVGLAAFYYVLNLAVRNRKYRWMGHGTLALTSIYLVSVGVSRFDPLYRVLSFLVLGTVLLIVSLSFTRARRRRT